MEDLNASDFKQISALIVDMAYYLFNFLSEHEAQALTGQELKRLYNELMNNREQCLFCFDEYLGFIETSNHDFSKFSRFFNEAFNTPISGSVIIGNNRWERINKSDLNYKRDFREINNFLLDKFILKQSYHQKRLNEFIDADGINGLIEKYFNGKKSADETPEQIKLIVKLEYKSISDSDSPPTEQLELTEELIEETRTLKMLFNEFHDEFDNKVKKLNDKIVL
jgi:hypothetical protein